MAASGLSCSTRDLSLWHAGFCLVVACRFSLSSCGAQAPRCVSSVVCVTQALAEARALSSCGTWALVAPRYMGS